VSAAAYTLLDGEKQHAAHPQTFHIPPRAERESLEPGVYAKCVFSDGGKDGERMWVRVDRRLADDQYVGTLRNDPAFLTCIRCDDTVLFGPEHVIDIWEPL
jgi:hypothetical protein